MNLAESRVSVRAQDLSHGASACVTPRQWSLRTLVAYLFDGRECDEVRRLLAQGSGIAHGTRASWQAVELSAAELSAIESTFPKAMPERELHLPEVRHAVIVASRGEPGNIATANPMVADAAAAAKYLYFDYGPWADLYEAALPDGAVLRYEVPRGGVVPPWSIE